MIKTFGSLIGRTRLLSIVLLTDIPGFPETLEWPERPHDPQFNYI